MPNRNSKSKTNPLISPATPIALQPHHLLSPPADLLANTATILTITPTQDTSPPSTAHPKAPTSATASAFTIHRIRAHETPDSPNRAVLLYTVYGKPWPNMTRTVCDAEDVPVLVLRRAWLPIRKWVARLPDQQAELMVASTPWVTDGPGSRIGVGGGFRLDVRFVNALASAVRERRVGSGSGSGLAVSDDEPPPYSAVSGVGVGVGVRGQEGSGDAGNEKDIHPHPHSRQDPVQAPVAPTLLPSYASVRRNSPNSLRDLLDAIEPPQEPAPASPFLSSASTSASRNANSSPGSSSGSSRTSPRPEANASPGAKVELKVKHLAGSGTGVMMGNQKIMHISRHNVMDYSRSKVKLRPRWEVEVSEGVDLLLAVNIVLIMAETVSSQNRWK
ncbi:hypothetical protein CBS147354_6096 [Penicillium roqueforti]|nr:hypothetical protein CBS147354_6096 [Penicillium roqueforti]